MPTMYEVTTALDALDFGPYETPANDCDVMACKARTFLKEKWPRLRTGIRIMFGFALPGKLIGRHGRVKWVFAGHGILVVRFMRADLYYDCTTADGKDSKRTRGDNWLSMWLWYLSHGYLVVFWYTIWGDYTPARKGGKWAW